MSNLTPGARVRVVSNQYQFDRVNMTGVIAQKGPIPHSWYVRMDHDGHEICWHETFLVAI